MSLRLERWVFVPIALLLVGCSDTSSRDCEGDECDEAGEEETQEPPDALSCGAYLECLSAFDSPRLGKAMSAYGEGGSCWGEKSPDLCLRECELGVELECDGDEDPEGGETGEGGGLEAVDILFVIDNSGSMGEEQANLAQQAGPLLTRLADAGIDYRVAFTDSDNGNPRCSGTNPTPGVYKLTSCLDRLEDFVFTDTNVQAVACENECSLSAEQLSVVPTKTDYDSEAKARPWLQWSTDDSNLPEGVDMEDAFACLAPQGINGCGFESQLETMLKALVRSQRDDEAEYGFLRDDAALAVIFITDEADCSYNPAYQEIFLNDGEQTFWAHADEPPTSAICWNAGVECSGTGSAFEDCQAVDKAVDGTLTDDPEKAVLYPVERYISALDSFRRAGKPLLVAAITGVSADGSVSYQDVQQSDPNTHATFGIGAGCVGGGGTQVAIPPVRIRQVVEHFNEDQLYSICSDTAEQLGKIGDSIVNLEGN